MAYNTAAAAPRKISQFFVAALMAGTMLSTVQFVTPAAHAQASQGQAGPITIPAGALTPALNRLAAQTGLQILFDARVATGKRTSGVRGAQTPNAALTALLDGTGVSFRYTGANTVTLVDPSAGGNNASATVDGAIALDTIDVSGGGGRAEAADAPYVTPGTSAHISAETLRQVPLTTPGDMFKTVPGVTVTGNRAGVSMDVNIRGLQGMNRVATTIDGAMQQTSYYKGYMGHGSRVYVDPELLADVVIEKGPGSAPGAMGGSVDMRTLNARDIVEPGKTYGVRIRGGIGSNSIKPDDNRFPPAGSNFSNPRPPGIGLLGGPDDGLSLGNSIGSMVVGYATQPVEFAAGFAARKSGNYFAGTKGTNQIPGTTDWRHRFSQYHPGEEVHNTSQDTRSAFAKLLVRPTDGHSMEIGYVRYDSTFGEGYRDTLSTALSKRQTGLSTVDTNTYTARYTWNPADNPLIELRANLWASDISNYFGGLSLQTDAFTWGGDIKNTSRWSGAFGALKITYGAQFFRDRMDSLNIYPGNILPPSAKWGGQREMTSVFANAEYLAANLIRFDVGVKRETYTAQNEGAAIMQASFDESRINPTAGIALLPFEGVQIFAKYAEGWRPPSIQEISVAVGATISDLLRPETSRNWEYGVNIARDGLLTADDKLRLKVAYFDNDYEDYIARTGLGWATYNFTNIPGMKMKGVEISGSYDAGWVFTHAAFNRYTDVQYCLSTCERFTSGSDYGSTYIPPEYTATASLGVRLFDRKLTLGGRATSVGKRAIGTAAQVGAPNYGSAWAPYQIYDLFGSYKFNENAELHLSAENLTDRYFIDAMSDDRLPGPGRTLRATMTLKF